MLSPAEAGCLRALAVFPGSFDMEGARAVNGVADSDALSTLALLVDKSLVSAEADGERVTYRLMEMTRRYCLDRLLASGEHAEVCRRHAEHVCAVLERARSEWSQRPATEWGVAYGRIIDDLGSALAWTSRDGSANRALRTRLTLAGIPCR